MQQVLHDWSIYVTASHKSKIYSDISDILCISFDDF